MISCKKENLKILPMEIIFFLQMVIIIIYT